MEHFELKQHILMKLNARKRSAIKRSSRRQTGFEPLEARLVLDSTVVLNEIMYNPSGADESLEWIELHNQMAVDMDISQWRLNDAVDYRFAEGTVIPGGGYLVIAADPVALQTATGFDGAIGPYVGSLSNGGERIELLNNSDRSMNVVDYGDEYPWPVAADGSGASLAKADENGASSEAGNWTFSPQLGGTPGQENFPSGGQQPSESDLVLLDDVWSYDDSGVDPGPTWSSPGFGEPGWQAGDGVFFAGNIDVPDPPTPPNSLVGWWTFDNTTEDGSNHDNDGQLLGGSYSPNVPGEIGFGRSLEMQAGDAGFRVPADATLNSSVFTLSYWIDDPGQVSGTGVSNGETGHNRVTSRTGNAFETAVNNSLAGGGSSRVKFYSGAAPAWRDTPYQVTSDDWTHIAYVYDGLALTVYANGESVHSESLSIAPSGDLVIGARFDGIETFVGNIDDVALWNVALASSSIRDLAEGEVTPATASTSNTASADPVRVGSGSDLAGAVNADSDGIRLNVEPAFVMNLPAGTYDVQDVSFAANSNGAGQLRAFLAVLTGVGPTYQTIWASPATTPPGGDSIHTINYAAGSQQFTLAADTNVYAGSWHDGNAKVKFSGLATITNHDNSPITPTAAGQTISAFSHPTLNDRTYAYHVTVAPQVAAAVGSNVDDWRVSTATIDGDPAGDWDPTGDPAPPATGTFTIVPTQTSAGVVGHIDAAAGSLDVDGLTAGPNVSYYRTTFQIDPFDTIAADIEMAIDAGAQLYINGTLVATEVNATAANYTGDLPSLAIAEDGAIAANKFDATAGSFSGFVAGTNEIIVALRNPNDDPTPGGGFAFRMDLNPQVTDPGPGDSLSAFTLQSLGDDFTADTIDALAWDNIEYGLESRGAGSGTSYSANTTSAADRLTISGTANVSFWGGRSLRSVKAFDSSLATTIAVDRVSLSGAGSAYRSSLWLWADDGNYVHFSHNVGENGWSYNVNNTGGAGTSNPIGGGNDIGAFGGLDGSLGDHEMKLVYLPRGDGSADIEIYLDDVLGATHTVTNWPKQFRMMLTGQGRAAGDTVNAVFDNAHVTQSVAARFNTEMADDGSGDPQPTYYFRREFTFNDNPARTTLELMPLVDDGAVFYLNGVEVLRHNMPGGAVSHGDPASAEVDGTVVAGRFELPTGSLVQGTNVLAVALHPAAGSDDVYFGAQLSATVTPPDPESIVALLFNEAASATDPSFWVEIANPNDAPVDVAGYAIGSSDELVTPYVFPAQVLPAGGLLQVTAAELGFSPANGDKLFLYAPGQTAITDGVEIDNRLIGRSAAHDGRWLFPAAPAPGAANSFAFNTDIVINEIMYNPPGILGDPGTPPTFDATTLVMFDSTWRHSRDDAPYNPGANWDNTAHAVDDVNWFSAQAPMGFESSALPIALNTIFNDPQGNAAFVATYYFETDFGLTQAQIDALDDLSLRHMIDDGAVFYINGAEVDRFNMPAGTPNVNTFSATGVGDAVIGSAVSIPKNSLVALPAMNRLSVEVHQRETDSSDVVFAAELLGRAVTDPGTPPTPFSNSNEQWIELTNRGAAPVDLTGWEFTDGVNFDFAPATTLNPGEYLVVARDSAALLANHPGIAIAGEFSGNLSRSGERLELTDSFGNPADELTYFDDGRWTETADGRGSSLELRDVDADNFLPESWAASDESGNATWQTITYRGLATNTVGPTLYNELVLGLLDEGVVLLDDISVIEDPDGTARQLIQNGSFDTDSLDASPTTWRIIGTHGGSRVVVDPNDAGNRVLRLAATGPTEHMHNHAETTLKDGAAFVTINSGLEYEISFRARWVEGSNQLNSRLYFNRLQRTTLIDRPTTGGTPGAANSRSETNIGPTFGQFSHGPVVPSSNEDVNVTLSADDPDGVASMTLLYSIDGGAAVSVAMTDRGGGVYTGVIPGQAASTVVQFWAEGQDALGAVSTYPAEGAASRALYKVEDNQASTLDVHNFRIIMTAADANLLHQETNVMSNARIGATVVYNESEVFYDVGVRLKGSERGRSQDVRVSFNVEFDPMQLFRGVHKTVAIDRSGAGNQFSQKEIIVKHAINHAGGIATQYDDLIHVIAPRNVHTGSAMLQMARYGDLFLDETFDNGSDGQLFEYELIYYPTTTTGGVEGLKRPQPDSVIGVPIADRGENKEDYRWNFQIKNNREQDDYSTIIPVLQTVGMSSGTQFHQRTDELLDVDQWLRSFAVQTLWGIGDNYASGAQHNAQFYTRPSDGKTLFLPWDMDFTASVSATAGLSLNGDLNKLLTLTDNNHHYLGHLEDIITTTFNNAYMDEWIDHFDSLLPAESLAQFIGYVGTRSNHVLNSLPAQVTFAISTGDPLDVGASATASLSGNGWVDVREIRLAGESAPLDVTWNTTTSWQLVLPVNFGENTYTLEAYDFQGNLIGTDTIQIASSLSSRPAQDFLRITELNYNPDGPDVSEFIELQNTSDAQTLDLTGVTIADGPSVPFAFDSGTTLGPGEFLLVVGDASAFASAYPTVPSVRVAGQFDGALSNGGERIHLVDADGATVLDFIYQDGDDLGEEDWPEETDGSGFSLVIADPSADPATWNDGQSWRSSALLTGSPGETDPTPVPGDFNGDGVTNRTDVVLLLSNYGRLIGSHRFRGDFNGDQSTNLIDVVGVQINLGATVAPSPAGAAAIVVDAISHADASSDSVNADFPSARSRLARRIADSTNTPLRSRRGGPRISAGNVARTRAVDQVFAATENEIAEAARKLRRRASKSPVPTSQGLDQ